MNHFVIMALVATLGTWFVTALGAAMVVFFTSPDPKSLNIMLGFASGVMIAASFWSLLQPAIERAEATSGPPAYLVATAGFLCGALFMWASDKIVSFARRRTDLAGGKSNERLPPRLPPLSFLLQRFRSVRHQRQLPPPVPPEYCEA